MSKEERKVYANSKQIKFLRSRAKRKTFHAGRGASKSTTLGFTVALCFENLPRAKILVAGLTYVQLDLIVVTAIREALGFLGYHEYNSKYAPFGVYVVGKKAPDNWVKPYKEIGALGHQYTISFINGFTIQFVSQDRPETHRGLSSDGLLIDESATIKEEFVTKVLLPTVRANEKTKLSKSHLHHIFYDFSSASWTPSGMWIYKNEELYFEEQKLRADFTDKQLKEIPPKHLFLESTYLDNLALPATYGENLKELLDPLEFEVEVMNKRVGKKPTSFYHQFDDKTHTYFKSIDYKFDEQKGLYYYQSNDYITEAALELSLDFNAAICWAVVGQEVDNEQRIINSKYIKPMPNNPKSLITQIGEWFIETYAQHKKKQVNLYGDPGGNNRSANTSQTNKTFYQELKDVLIKSGWRINDKVLKSYPRHKEKYRLVNHLLSENSPRTPRIRINANTNKVLIIAIQSAEIKALSDTFEKDKSSETSKEQRQREYATDSTDALDYLLYPKFFRLMPTLGGNQKTIIYTR